MQAQSGPVASFNPGTITLAAGGATTVCAAATDTVGDGCPATQAKFSNPFGIAVDAYGNIFVADTGNNRIRLICYNIATNSTNFCSGLTVGNIYTVAGNGNAGSSGDGGLAINANIHSPNAVVLDPGGNLYIADTSNYKIRKVTPAGIIGTFAGTGSATTTPVTSSGAGDGGQALSATFSNPDGLAVDSAGNIYVIGTAGSDDFPVTSSAFASVRYGPTDAFITELNPNSAGLLYSTYIGGEADDFGQAIAVAGPGKVYFAINSQSGFFPTTGGAYKAELTGAVDGVLGLMDLTKSGLNSLVYATYWGGSDLDEVRGIAVDVHGNLLATGYTMSVDFPVTGDAMQSVYNGNGDVFVSVVNPAVPGFVVYSTYLGGTDAEVGYAIAGDSAGNIYVTGYTLS